MSRIRRLALAAQAARLLPGLLLAATGAAIGFAVHAIWPAVQPGTVAVVLGALLINLGRVPALAGPGLTFTSKKLLRLAVVLLGFSLSLRQVADLGIAGLLVVLATVAIAFFGTLGIARVLRVNDSTGLLVATGFSICGASAIAAMEPIARGKKRDTTVAVALVTLYGSLAIVVLPLLRGPLGLDDPVLFGQWVGASVHDVGQTVAAANVVPGALESAVVVKLTRVLLLAPLVAGCALWLRSRRPARRTSAVPRPGDLRPNRTKRPAILPLFVAAFIAVIVLNSLVELPAGLLDAAHLAHQVLLAAALFALGTGIHWRIMREAGVRPVVLGLLSWVLIAATAYTGVLLIS